MRTLIWHRRRNDNGKEAPPLVRDIDDWMFHFERRAAPRLKRIFTEHLEELPQHLLQLLDKLRSAEASRREENERRQQSSDR